MQVLDILSPVVGNTDYAVKSSCEFTDFIREAEMYVFQDFLAHVKNSKLNKVIRNTVIFDYDRGN